MAKWMSVRRRDDLCVGNLWKIMKKYETKLLRYEWYLLESTRIREHVLPLINAYQIIYTSMYINYQIYECFKFRDNLIYLDFIRVDDTFTKLSEENFLIVFSRVEMYFSFRFNYDFY